MPQSRSSKNKMRLARPNSTKGPVDGSKITSRRAPHPLVAEEERRRKLLRKQAPIKPIGVHKGKPAVLKVPGVELPPGLVNRKL